jgi:hypothetical protein
MERTIDGLRISFNEDRATLPNRQEFIRIHQLTPNYQGLSVERKAQYLADLRAVYVELSRVRIIEPIIIEEPIIDQEVYDGT